MTKDGGESVRHGADAGASDRSFRYALVVYALVEFFAIALLLYYKFAR